MLRVSSFTVYRKLIYRVFRAGREILYNYVGRETLYNYEGRETLYSYVSNTQAAEVT